MKHSFEVKLAAVNHYLAGHAGIISTAKLFQLSHTSLSHWINLFLLHGPRALDCRHKRSYSPEDKLCVVLYALGHSESLPRVAARFNIPSHNTVKNWIKGYRKSGNEAFIRRRKEKSMTRSDDTHENEANMTPEEMKNELRYLRAENAYLKAMQEHLLEKKPPGAGEKTKVIRSLRCGHCQSDLLKAAGLARSTLYYQLSLQKAKDKYADVKQLIASIFHEHRGCYGYRRIHCELQKRGLKFSGKTVRKLMQQLGLKSPVRLKKYRSYRGNMGLAAENILQRQFKAEAPCEKWVTDITEFRAGGQKLYLSPILDLFNGEIVAWETACRPTEELVKRMLNKGLESLAEGEKPLLHSDQGWHYRIKSYQSALADRGLVQSMSRKGNCLDNAVMENFFGHLKEEMYYRRDYRSVEELENAVNEYITYWNQKRIKLSLGGLSPVEYRTEYQKAG
ncbi:MULTISPECIES: IS3-like element IS1397 family transposase [Pseudomonadati]|uniref:IS3-like element IS1397 family transposase n=11 Tax=Pseudomonadati TaxID=3379134 RepID=A0A7J5NSY7_9BACE|nr:MULTISPECIES: IS3-like element IS1397 family transposase [Bacteria]EGE1876860.1 IS3-like element IS1397 family transposase [Escherichia coli]KAB6077726.1 IS3-like element IS1397 family transposase [Bacteroides xylanisolvens]MBA5626071.1 IS3-like element IS1397 family transposase [Escherichia coli]MBE8069151.1 IS3-like element IS1397 family transposase [Escherichia coli]MCN1777427.1 IS3-like element IS1397 family transposase [Escherichia coli]